MYDIVILGAGGCGREVFYLALDTFSSKDYHIKGFLSDDKTVLDPYPEICDAFPIIDSIVDYVPGEKDRFLLAMGDVRGRKKVAESIMERGGKFISLIHPKAMIFPGASIGKNVIIYPAAIIGPNTHVGDFCQVSSMSTIGHDACIGNFCVLSPHVAVSGFAKIGKETFLGTHATVGPKVEIGERGTVSASSFVARNTGSNAFIIGVPGKEY